MSLYLDVDAVGQANALLDRKTSTPRSDTPSFIQGDVLTLKLFLRQCSSTVGGASTAATLIAGDTLVCAARPAANIASGALLFIVAGLAAAGTGDDLCYQATLDLNTAEIVTALASSDTLSAVVDVEIADASGAFRGTLRFNITILRQIYDGTAGGAGINPLPNGFVFYRNGAGADCLRIVNRDGQTLLILEPPGA